MKKKGLIISIALILLCTLAGCGKKLTDRNSTTVTTDNFSIKIYDDFEEADDEDRVSGSLYSFGYGVTYEKNKNTILHIYDDGAYFLKLEAYMQGIIKYAAEAYEMDESAFEIEEHSLGENGDIYYTVSYKTKVEGLNCDMVMGFVYKEGQVLMITEGSPTYGKKRIMSDISNMIETIEYIGEDSLPEVAEYPVETPNYTFTIDKGFRSTGELEDGKYVDDDNHIVIRYIAADDYDKGTMSRLQIDKLDGKSLSAKEYAMEETESLDEKDGWEASISYNTWKDICDKEIDGSQMTNIPGDTEVAIVNFTSPDDSCADLMYLEINGEVYKISVVYPKGDAKTRSELFHMLKSLEFK
jgi:hypothetical protein